MLILITSFLLILFFFRPFFGLVCYLLFEGYISLQTIQFYQIPDIHAQLASINQLIILSVVIGSIFSKRVSESITPSRGNNYLSRYTKSLTLLVIFFILWSFLTYFWAETTMLENVIFELTRLIKLFGFVLATVLIIKTQKQLKTILILGLGIYFIQDLIQISEYIISDRLIIQGGGLSLLAVSIMMVGDKDLKTYYKLFFLICIFIVISSFLLAGTRRGFGGIVIVILVTIYCNASRRTFISLLFSLLVIGYSINLLGEVELGRRISQTKRLINLEDDYAWSSRNNLWRAGWEMVKERPITGHGYGLNQFLIPYYVQKIGKGYRGEIRMHNTYLKAWVELGFIGLICFLGIMYTMIRSFYLSAIAFKKQGDEIMYVLLFASFASMIGYLGIAVFGWSGYLDKPFWFQIGLAFAASKILYKDQMLQKMSHT